MKLPLQELFCPLRALFFIVTFEDTFCLCPLDWNVAGPVFQSSLSTPQNFVDGKSLAYQQRRHDAIISFYECVNYESFSTLVLPQLTRTSKVANML